MSGPKLTNAVDVFAATFVTTTTGHKDGCSQPRIGFGSRLADRTAARPTRCVKFHRVGRKAVVGAQDAGGTKQFAFLYATRRTQTLSGGGVRDAAAAALRNHHRRRLLLLHSIKSGGAAGDGIELARDVTRRCAAVLGGEFQLGSETGAGRRRARSMDVAEQDHIELFVGWRCTVVAQATRTLVGMVVVLVAVVVVRGGHQQQRRGTQQEQNIRTLEHARCRGVG